MVRWSLLQAGRAPIATRSPAAVRCKGLPAEPGAPVAAMQATMLLRASPAPLARPLLAASRASAAGGARLRASPLALPPLRCRRRVAVAHAPRAAASAAGGAPAAGSPDDPFKARRRHVMRIMPFRVRVRIAHAGCVSTARAVGRSTQTLSRCVSATSPPRPDTRCTRCARPAGAGREPHRRRRRGASPARAI